MKLWSALLIIFSFSGALAKFAPSTEKTFHLQTTKSEILWAGEKEVFKDAGSKHKGTILLKSGNLKVKDGKISGGSIQVDMTSIKNTDVESPKWRKKLEDHLKSDDFFAVETNKTALFIIQKVAFLKGNIYKITGDMTIRGATKKGLSFEAEIIKKPNLYTTKGTLTLDRNDFGVVFNSKASLLKKLISIPMDKVIKDSFTLTFNLRAEPTIGFAKNEL